MLDSNFQDTNSPFRVAFISRGNLGYQVLQGLLADPNIVVPIIITCKHTPETGQSPEAFEALANKHNIEYHFTNNINKGPYADILKAANCDVAVAMEWINTIEAPVIEATRLGILNLHGGMLPRYRGNACSNWAILNHEQRHGITAHLMEPSRVDSGPVLLQEHIPIDEDTTITEIVSKIGELGKSMILQSVEALRTNTVVPIKQDESDALYCYPRLPRDGEIDWTQPGKEILRLIRAVTNPYPGAYSFYADCRDGHKIKKLSIYKARLESHPIQFCAVPGHVIKLNQDSHGSGVKDKTGRAVVCGDKQLLVLEDIAVNGQVIEPHLAFKTVRQRLGLDTATLLGEIQSLRNQLAQQVTVKPEQVFV